VCGIVGICLRDGAASRERLDAAMDLVRHRGPDESGIHLDGPAGLGHRRLSIIDLADGQQPMADRRGSLWVTYNGEIYNFAAIRRELEAGGTRFCTRSDTEVLVEAYRAQGRGCLTQLRGMFAFAVWDADRRELFLARDRVGVKPLYYAETEEGFVFASEIPALFALGDIPRTLDPVALQHFLTLQYVPAPRTGFAAVRKLPPAHWLLVRQGRVVQEERYWQVAPRPSFAGDVAEAEGEVRELLAEATRLRMISDVPLGAFLSGGVDSSVTVALMARTADRPVKTFCVGFPGTLDERSYAGEVAKRYGTEHQEVDASLDLQSALRNLVRQAGAPFADASLVPTFAVAAAGRTAITVALTGDGGDEAFGGYKRYGILGFAECARRTGLLPVWRTMRKTTLFAERALNPRRRKRYPAGPADLVLETQDPVEQYLTLTRIFGAEALGAMVNPDIRREWQEGETAGLLQRRWAQTEGADAICRWMDLDRTLFLAEDVLHKVDIASMAASLECRSPFLDHRVIEFAATLPASFFVDPIRKRGKKLLKSAFRDWLPARVMTRPKMGFTPPVADWLRGDLKALVMEQLLAPGSFFDVVGKDQVAWLAERHMNGHSAHGKALWTLLSLRLWWDTFKVTLP
jgi:asparagine synthase (glutamine-hydrolysing)